METNFFFLWKKELIWWQIRVVDYLCPFFSTLDNVVDREWDWCDEGKEVGACVSALIHAIIANENTDSLGVEETPGMQFVSWWSWERSGRRLLR